jgi:hypothetical protein
MRSFMIPLKASKEGVENYDALKRDFDDDEN